jgi:hypothetical protein
LTWTSVVCGAIARRRCRRRDCQPRTRRVEAHVPAWPALRPGRNDAVHLAADRAQRAKRFFELDQFRAILKHLPAEYRALFEISYITGWRIKSELLTRQWRHVEFDGKGWLRLEPGEAKDETAGREFQFTTWMREVLERQRKFVSHIERRKGFVIPWVFCRADGTEIRDYYTAWRTACRAAGIERMPHDFRRTAVRNFEHAGVPRTTAMAMVGHKTESIYRRYSIVDQAMLEAGTSKLDQHQQTQGLSKPVVVSMRRRRRTVK